MSNLFDSGGTAFPASWSLEDGATASHPGMTLRDWFAGKAMQAALVNAEAESEDHLPAMFEMLARGAYLAADAMLAERSKP